MAASWGGLLVVSKAVVTAVDSATRWEKKWAGWKASSSEWQWEQRMADSTVVS
jgi:hypothetical protein